MTSVAARYALVGALGLAGLALMACAKDEPLDSDMQAGDDDEPGGSNDGGSMGGDAPDDDDMMPMLPDPDDDDSAGGAAGGPIDLPAGGSGGIMGRMPTETDGLVSMYCESDDDCASGLHCETNGAWVYPEGGTIPMGTCTARCDDNPDICYELDAFSGCITFTAGTEDAADDTSYCMDLCLRATEGNCHGLPDRMCLPLQEDGLGICLPRCLGETSCGDEVCDGQSGACLAAERPGTAIGEACLADEDCSGGACLLLTDDAGMPLEGETGICSERCVFTPFVGACGWEDENVPPDFLCLPLGEVLTGEPFEFNDPGLCIKTCDVAADCGVEGFTCLDFAPEAAEAFGKAGFCLQESLVEDPNAGGAGGSSMGGSGTAGSEAGGAAQGGGGASAG